MTKVFSYPTKQAGISFTPRGKNVKKLAAVHTREIAAHKSEIQKVVNRVPDLIGPSGAGNRDVTALNGCINVLNGVDKGSLEYAATYGLYEELKNAVHRDYLSYKYNVKKFQEFVRSSRPQDTKKWKKLKVLNVPKFPEIPSL